MSFKKSQNISVKLERDKWHEMGQLRQTNFQQ